MRFSISPLNITRCCGFMGQLPVFSSACGHVNGHQPQKHCIKPAAGLTVTGKALPVTILLWFTAPCCLFLLSWFTVSVVWCHWFYVDCLIAPWSMRQKDIYAFMKLRGHLNYIDCCVNFVLLRLHGTYYVNVSLTTISFVFRSFVRDALNCELLDSSVSLF